MAQIPSSQGAPQFSNIAAQDALPLIGSLSRENGQTVLNYIDAELAKLFEDRNILLAEGGTITWSTTTNNLTFSAALKLHINSQIAGGSPTVIDLTSTTRAFSADNRMLYAVINRIAGTATVTADATTLPSVVAANIEVVLLAKRISGQIYFRNGFTLANGQTAVLGRHGSVIDTEFVINDSTDPTKQLAFDAAGTTGTKTTVVSSQTTNKTLTLPDATDTLVGKATTDSLSNKQVAYSSTTDSSTTGSNTTLASFSTGVVRLTNSSLVSLSGIPGGASGLSVIIENKTGNSIVINNEETTATAANRIQTGTNGNTSMANNASFLFVYDSTTSRWQLVGGTGSGSGGGSGKNYLSAITTSQSTTPNTGNGNFELGSTTGWSLGTVGTLTNNIPTGTPTFGSGASGNLSISAISSGQLAGSYSLSYTSSAATTQGNMLASDAFYIDTEDQAKVLGFKFYYKAQTNPTNANWSGTSSNSFAVAAWDVTNSAWLPLAGNFAMTQNSGVGVATGTFQTSSTTAQIRFVMYNANATSGAVTVYFDDFSVGPQITPQGAVVTDTTSFTTTWTSTGTQPALGNGTLAASYVRVGEKMFGQIRLTTGSTTTYGTGTYIFSIPSGFTIDATKSPSGSAADDDWKVGQGSVLQSGTQRWLIASGVKSTTTLQLFIQPDSTTGYVSANATVSNTIPVTFSGAGNVFAFNFVVPITGWSSNVQMSNDTDTRVVAASYYLNSSTAFTATNTIVFDTVKVDTHGAFSSGTFVTPVTGYYNISAKVFTTVGTGTIAVYVNGTNVENIFSVVATGNIYSGNTIVSLKAGDIVTLRPLSNMTIGGGGVDRSEININRMSGPAVIAATESINMRANNSTTSMTSGGTGTIIFASKDYDSHGAYNTSTGVFTAPISGKYTVSAQVGTSTAGTASYLGIAILKNGGGITRMEITNGNARRMGIISDIISLNAGDTLSIQYDNQTGATNSVLSAVSSFAVARVGN